MAAISYQVHLINCWFHNLRWKSTPSYISCDGFLWCCFTGRLFLAAWGEVLGKPVRDVRQIFRLIKHVHRWLHFLKGKNNMASSESSRRQNPKQLDLVFKLMRICYSTQFRYLSNAKLPYPLFWKLIHDLRGIAGLISLVQKGFDQEVKC